MKKYTSVNSIKSEVERLINIISSFPKSIETSYKDLSQELINPGLKSMMNESVPSLSKNIESMVRSLNRTIRNLLDSQEWKTLNIGFFGETNVGKSTIIEALSRGDGSTIGDGRKDYTKEVIVREVNIDGYKLKLIDMPGIEGNEKRVQEKIKRAVNSCHIVFFMSNSDKEIERGTLEKLKSYLNERALVFGLLNRRSNIQKLMHNKSLFDEDTIKVASRVHEQMRKTLDNYYGGEVIVVDALLAFLSRGKLKRSFLEFIINFILKFFRKPKFDFLDYKEKVLRILGGEKELMEASGINSLLTKLNEACKKQEFYIFKYNVRKITKEMKDCLENIVKEIDTFASNLSFDSGDYKILKEAKNDFYYTRERIKAGIDDILDNVKIRIRDEGFSRIDAGEEQFSINIGRYIEEELDEISRLIKKEIESFVKSVEKKLKWIKILDNRQGGTLYINSRALAFETSVWEVFQSFWEPSIAKLIGSLAGIPFGLVGSIIGYVVGGFFDLFMSPEEIKSKRKKKFLSMLEEQFSIIRYEILRRVDFLLNSVEEKLDEAIELLEQDFEKIGNYVYNLKSEIKEIIKEVNSFDNYIKT